MSIESTLYSTLSGDSGVTALVSTRVYPTPAPEAAALPMVVYQNISGGHISLLPGVGEMTRKLIQLSCHATTLSDAEALADAVISALEGNGYITNRYHLYDPTTQTHTVAVDWSFLN